MMNEKIELTQTPARLTKKQVQDLDAISAAYGGVKRSNLIRMAVAEFIWKHQHLIEE